MIVTAILIPGITERPKIDYSLDECPSEIHTGSDESIELNYKNRGGIEVSSQLVLNGENVEITENIRGEEKIYISKENGTYTHNIGLSPNSERYSSTYVTIRAVNSSKNASIDFKVEKRPHLQGVSDIQALIFGETTSYAPNRCEYIPSDRYDELELNFN